LGIRVTMEISTNILRSDLVRLNLFLLPRAKSNVIFVAVLSVLIFFYLFITKRPDTLSSVVVAVFSALVGAIGGLLAGFVISLVFILLAANQRNGVLGHHRYSITPEGLHETTSSNEGMQRWTGIQDVGKSSAFIFIRINGYSFHLLPRRAFSSEHDFESFWVQAHTFWKQAAQQDAPSDVRNART
jgi:hypothetical protein